jgi:hypothetical protein
MIQKKYEVRSNIVKLLDKNATFCNELIGEKKFTYQHLAQMPNYCYNVEFSYILFPFCFNCGIVFILKNIFFPTP